MWRFATLLGLCCTALWSMRASAAEANRDPSSALAAGADDRLMMSADATHLADATGGGGGQLAWLHDIHRARSVAAGVEYQSLAGGNWLVGSLSGTLSCEALSTPIPGCSLTGEIHEGAGRTGAHSFRYAILAAGVGWALGRQLTMQLEERYVDVDSSFGHLPKVTLAFLGSARWLTTLAYAHSAGGNLATELLAARLDLYRPHGRILAGAALGSAAPAVINLQSAAAPSGRTLKEGFLGFARPLRRGELQVLGDYLRLGEGTRLTFTVSYMMRLRP